MMANQNTFLCECGRVIGRMPKSAYHLPWNAEQGDPVHRGVMCGGCRLNWIYINGGGEYVNVKKCCFGIKCNGDCQ